MQRTRQACSQAMRPIQQQPSWMETIIHRPIRVECWTCLRPAWLHRNQHDASPLDWTCPNCLTHQKRDKDGTIVPVPEMFDSTLNEDVSARISRSLKSRRRPSAGNPHSSSQGNFFCEMCNGHQRIVYQLLSNYIPDEEDENYETYYGNADTYRRQLEERYPLACANCLDKVHKELAQQNYRIKSSLLNSTLSKSRGDHIRPTRKYPSLPWLLTGFSWTFAHAELMAVEAVGALGSDILPSLWVFDLSRRLVRAAGTFTIHNTARGISGFNLSAMLPWSSSFGQLFLRLSKDEQSAIIVATLAIFSIVGFFWDPLAFTVQKSPWIRIRTRWYYHWMRMCALLLSALQYYCLFSWKPQQDPFWAYGILLVTHLLYVVAFINSRYLQEPLTFKQGNSVTHTLAAKALDSDSPKISARTTNALPTSSRARTYQSTNTAISSSMSLHGVAGSRSVSPDVNDINWSPKKPSSTATARLPAQFGMYRDPSLTARQDETSMLSGTTWAGHAGSLQAQQSIVLGGASMAMDNKFRSRAYEPSPLADPSLITNMSLNNISLGKMFGFPSATFQPPENHFAHRSGGQHRVKESDTWSYRRSTKPGSSGLDRSSPLRSRPSLHSGFSDNAEVDMDDDEGEVRNSRIPSGLSGTNFGFETDNDHLSSFGSSSMNDSSKNGWAVDGREAFAAQRYFPPEPETGLEDNFFGVVKIVDDYLPPSPEPRSIVGRNLMLKKRMARLWLALMLLCRSEVLWKAMGIWSWQQDWARQALFIAVMLHATAFWILDEYRTVGRYLDKKPASAGKNNAPGSADPFEPRIIDKVCSNTLLLLLLIRIVNVFWMLGDTFWSHNTSSGDPWSQLDNHVDTTRDAAAKLDVMDWSPRIVHWIAPWIRSQDAVRMLALQAGWVQDGLTIVLLVVLMAFGAGLHTAKSHAR
ncbi:Ima1 N-terminal domain-containing protein [Gamsiella multidivaricata]|uniref:Ima1 N-terminal domain-containing protein n=1 Tax=Gamsiella multidivaricata TaxID=101098 RepID=UPI00221FBCFD|nr:Ima1 N-terminal domain-containing protein [Gamsiella multidivaricata]KAI7816739.1 Ima1 N-terminal domain-containing protein [Gamsiella multidivaricata]